ncbi:DUF1126 PH like domain [Trypanosoma vivax]|uniref:Putative nucleoside diphosphate kinase n=1 Tax=Trypanosoma vivax (strain Y486) TaxID=1055687 RepID=G0TU44_TRYVY|nr:putative nucleoside diphosphate kinase [Trypanosoma vivax]KAH8613850.1 DUF1126 PH like domain [Trypanosoma vivax]CCC47478.1 putative nucleoside diphosphate kinase [Trypanosoma vivax Y486]
MALSAQDPHLSFYCEQHDHISQLTRRFILRFFYEDRSVEMRELPKNTLYLKRTPFPHLQKDDFKIGASLTLLGGILKLTAYCNEVTRELCSEGGEFTVVMFGETMLPSVGHYLAILTEECGFTILDIQMVWAVEEEANKYEVPEELIGGRVVVVKCASAEAILKAREYMSRAKGSWAAESQEKARKWEEFMQGAKQQPVAIFEDLESSVVIIKPHVIQKRGGGVVIQQLVDAGLEITALSLVNLSSRVVNEFMEPYKGVLPDFAETARALVGAVWVLQLISLDEKVDIVSLVREVCGPFDPVIAKELRPNSIRARFGIDRPHNAVHCCDLPGEGIIYTNLFFKRQDVEE